MNTNDFKAFCAKAKKIVKNNNTLPSLDYVKFTGDKVIVSNLEVFLEMKVEKHFEKDIYVNFKDFDKIISKCKNSPIDIVQEDDCKVCIKTNKGDFEFTDSSIVFDSDGESLFPILSDVFTDTKDILSKDDIKLVKKAVTYASDNELKPILMNVFVDLNYIVGTDANSLGRYERSGEQKFSFMIPKSIVPLLDSTQYSISSANDNKMILLQDDSFFYYFRACDGNYPNFNAVIPSSDDTETFFEISSDDLLSICESALIIADKNSVKRLILDINTKDKKIAFSMEDINWGKSFKKEISCDMGGGDIQIGFCPDLIMKMIKNEKKENYLFLLTQPNKAAFINSEVILMPVIVNY